MRATILALIASASLCGALPVFQESPGAALVFGAAAVEPPLRVQLTVGDEVLELALGGRGALADGRPVAIEWVDVRTFAVPAAFELDYPRTWRFSGGGAPATGVGAWWTLGGDGMAIYLRRHPRGAAEVLEEYARNLATTGGRGRRATTVDFGGRVLAGVEFDLEVGGIGGYPTTDWLHQVVAFEQAPGVSWLVVLQRRVGSAELVFDGVPLELEVDGETILVPSSPAGSERADPYATELAAIARAVRWL